MTIRVDSGPTDLSDVNEAISERLTEAQADALYEPLITTIAIPAGAMAPSAGTPTLTSVSAGNVRPGVWSFADAATSGVSCDCIIPMDWLTVKVEIVWTALTGGPADVVWDFRYYNGSPGQTLSGGTIAPNVVGTAAAAPIETAPLLLASDISILPGQAFYMRIIRLGADAADTLAAAAGLLRVLVTKIS